MNRFRQTTCWMRALACGAAALVLAGCGQVPLAPVDLSSASNNAYSESSLSLARGAGGGSANGAENQLTNAELNAVLGGAPTVIRSSSVVGASGGTVSLGGFTVKFPAGSFQGTATVTIRMSSVSAETADLVITPGNLNNFRKPVALKYSALGLTTSDLMTIYWYNPSTKTWVDLRATRDGMGNPTVYLSHFSVYRATKSGKAGW